MEMQPLSGEMIRHYLEEDDDEYEIDEDGDFSVDFEYDEECACELTAYLSVNEGSTYSIEVVNDRDFPRSEWDRLVWMCNEWNNTERYPTAHLNRDDNNPDQADIRLDHYVYLPAGGTQQQIDDLSEEIVESAFDFWKWAHEEHGL